MKIVLLAQCITEDCLRRRKSEAYLSAAGRKKSLNLCAYLVALGHDVTVLSNSYARSTHPAHTEHLSSGIAVRHSPTWSVFSRHSLFKRTIATLFNLVELFIRRRETDLVIIYNYTAEYSIPALVMAKLFGTTIVLDYEDGLFLDRRYRTAWYRIIERSVYRTCAAFILVNPGLKNRIESRAPSAALKPVAVIHSLFNGARIEMPRFDSKARGQLLFTGNFSRGFGFDELRLYIENLPERYTLSICGKANAIETEEIRGLCQIHRRARLLGFVPETTLRNLLAACEAVVLLNDPSSPYSQTNFPSKLYDYLSNGKVVISTKSATLRAYESMQSMLFLDSIPHDMPKLGRLLATRRFEVAEVEQLHERILETLNTLLIGTTGRPEPI